jgi:hypothetical protein
MVGSPPQMNQNSGIARRIAHLQIVEFWQNRDLVPAG